jgi:tRNA dimethylallyltransferase
MSKIVIVIVGPTASGKSSLAIRLAKKLQGEVISADSRQVYKGMNLGTGKVTKKEMAGIPHHLLDVVNPKNTFNVNHYQQLGRLVLNKIWAKNKTPIICGGTGFYIKALVEGLVLPEVSPNKTLRNKLTKLNTEELFKILKKKDPERAKNIDSQNPARLIRSIEIATALGKVPKLKANPLDAEIIYIGINPDKEKLKSNIHKRLLARIKLGMLTEIKKLHKSGVSFKKLESFGLEYRYGALLLQNKINKNNFITELEKSINDYAKRQMTWFKRNPNIHWVKNLNESLRFIKSNINK